MEQQHKDADLAPLFEQVLSDEEISANPARAYYFDQGVLMRKWRPSDAPADADWAVIHQVVVPKVYREGILNIAHSIPLGGHLGINKTVDKVQRHFFWPCLRRDVRDYVKTCHTCQVVGKPNATPSTAPLHPIPAFHEPFQKILLDCVGPLPKTRAGNEYLLTIMCTATRFPEAIPLRNITAKDVSKAFTKFSFVGLPKEVQTDQGSNFMFNLCQQVLHELGIKPINSSFRQFDPGGQVLVLLQARFHGPYDRGRYKLPQVTTNRYKLPQVTTNRYKLPQVPQIA